MKKLLLTLFATATVLAASYTCANAEKVIIPDYDFVLENSSIYYKDSIYPLLSYKDVTYFPMTWDYCRALNLRSTWVEGEGLFIAYLPKDNYDPLPIYETTANKKSYEATVAQYPIYLNGEKIDNENEEYPLLNFRGVTYFPMTWDYAREELNWDTSWQDGLFTIKTGVPNNYSTYFYSADDKGAYFKGTIHVTKEIDGQIVGSSEWNIDEYKYLDFVTDEIKYVESVPPQENKPYVSVETEIREDGFIYADGIKLGKAPQTEDIAVYCSETAVDSYRVFEQTTYTSLSVPAPYTPANHGVYVILGDKAVFLNENAYVGEACVYNGDLYLNLKRYTGWKGITFPQDLLYKVSPDGEAVCINERFPDYGSMEILGIAKDKLYLKCLWGPQEQGLYLPCEVSPYNDGYFTFDGEKLEKILKYRYSDEDILSPDGKIYTLINWKNEIKRIY